MKLKNSEGRPLQPAVEWLRSEYSARRSRNPSYSLRAFARHVSIGSGPLSEILLNKRAITRKMGSRIAARLGFSDSETERFLQAIDSSKNLAVSSTEKPYQQLNEDVFHLVSDWYHYAIRELVSTEDFKKEDRWIARRLGISTTEVRGAWERLLRLGLIEKKRDKWVAVQSVTTTQDIPSLAIRKFHQQTISKSLASVDETPVGLRDLSSTTMATDLAKVKLAKVAIKKFRRKMAAAMERGRKSEVYQLNIQLIPLTTQEITDASCN